MRLQFLRKPDLPSSGSENDLNTLRETIVRRLLWTAVIVGLPAVAFALPPSIANKRWIAIGIYGGAYLWMLFNVVLQDKLPLWLKIISLTTPLYALGVINLLNNGLMKDGAVFLLAFIFLMGLLLGVYAGLAALALSLLSFAVVGQLVISKTVDIAVVPINSVNPSEWFSSGGVLTLLGFVVTLAMTAMLQGLKNGLQQRGQLATDLERERELLKARTRDLQHRLTQLRTAAEVSRRFGTVMEPQSLLQQVADLLAERLNLYFVGIFLVDEHDTHQNQFARLYAGSGEAGKKLIADEYQILIGGTSIISQAITDRKACISSETSKEEFRAVNPFLPLTRSEVALPLAVGQRIVGAMSLQANKSNAFDADDISILQGIAETIANTLENDRLVQKLQNSLDEIQRLNEQYTTHSWAEVAKETSLKYVYQPTPPPASDPTQENASPEKLEIPLVLRQQKIGKLKLEGGATSYWSKDQKAFVEAVTAQATQALENIRLIKETQRRAARQQFIADFARSVRSSTDVETILRTSLLELAQSLQASEASIQLRLPRGQSHPSDAPPEGKLGEAG